MLTDLELQVTTSLVRVTSLLTLRSQKPLSSNADFRLRILHQVQPDHLAFSDVIPTNRGQTSTPIQGLIRCHSGARLITIIIGKLHQCFVHGRLPYEKIKPDPILRNLLLSLPICKVIFTNGDKVHVSKALKRLGLEDCFEGIICFEILNPTSSPSCEAGNEPKIFDIDDSRSTRRATGLCNENGPRAGCRPQQEHPVQLTLLIQLYSVRPGQARPASLGDYLFRWSFDGKEVANLGGRTLDLDSGFIGDEVTTELA
uniref:Uncharacterized protein n=1 Tax=Ananas comosus var. bracteatus TaxID=296719 RepID=A0A6V7PSK8_ANACO|nr:unnamed protein product [Ananas comosus var. bracteatus]